MATPALNPDQLVDDDDRDLLDDLSSSQSGGGPDPADLDEIAPVGAAVAPVTPEPVVDAIPGGQAPDELDKIAAMAAPSVVPAGPVPGAGVIPGGEEVAKAQGIVDTEKAKANEATAQQIAAIAKEADEDARLERADYLERRKAAEADLGARTKAYQDAKMVDPNTKRSGFKSTLARIFGGLGAAFRSAGGGDSNNHVLAQMQQQWENDAEIQRANIAALRDQAVMARTRLGDVDEGRRSMMRDADARLLAKYDGALKQGEAQLKAQGVPQAQIDQDQRILALRAAQVAAKARSQKEDDQHALTQARIEAMKAKAARDRAKAAGRGGGPVGPGGQDAESLVAKHLIANPGDIPGATQMAHDLKLDKKRLDKVIANSKPTESQAKGAHQAKVGNDALDAIAASGYQPGRDEIQKWLNNSRLVHLADGNGLIGGGAALAQTVGLIPQSEVDGLSPEAAAYFGNVRRYMETIGRAQSGAAISPSEWTNFFNQYGPNSKGGLEAARKYLNDQARLSGVAGRQLDAGGAAKPAAAPSGGQDSEAVQWAKKNLGDPRAKEILRINGAR